MSNELTFRALEYVNSPESSLREKLISLIEFSGQSESAELITALKARLKDKSCPLYQIPRILEILKIGFDSLNIVFVYVCSLNILSRLRSLINRFQRSRDRREQEILQDVLVSIQEWSVLYGEITEESTLYGQVYNQLVNQGVEFPACQSPFGYDFLRAVIELRASIFNEDKTSSRAAYKVARQLKNKLKYLLLKEKNEQCIERLLFISHKLDIAMEEYEQFKGGRISIYNSSSYIPSRIIQEPVYKESFDPDCLNNSMEIGISEVFENTTEVEIDLDLSGEWKGLKKDYVKIKDNLEGKREEIEDLQVSVIELQEMNMNLKNSENFLTQSLKNCEENCRVLIYENENLKEKYGHYQEENKRLYEKNSYITREKSEHYDNLNLSRIEIIKLREENSAYNNRINHMTSQINKLNQEIESLTSVNHQQKQEIITLNNELLRIKQNDNEPNLILPFNSTLQENTSNPKLWAYSLADLSSIIYEDTSLEIGFRISSHSDFFFGNIYIGNKSSQSIDFLKTTIINENTGLQIKLNKEEELEPVLPGEQTNRMIAFKPTADLKSSPILHITLNSSELFILLPITLPLLFSSGKFSHNSTENVFSVPTKPMDKIIKQLNFYGKFETTTSPGEAVLQCKDALIRVNLTPLTIAVMSSSLELTERLSQTIYNLILFL